MQFGVQYVCEYAAAGNFAVMNIVRWLNSTITLRRNKTLFFFGLTKELRIVDASELIKR